MTEQQLREKLQFAYGNMPDAPPRTGNTPKHRLEPDDAHRHHRFADGADADGGWRGGGAVLQRHRRPPSQDGTEGDYQAHYLALEERYDSDLLSVSVNDAVYDGSVLAFTM